MKIKFRIEKKYFIGLLLIASVLAVYWSIQDYDFVSYDDRAYITSNPHIQTGLTCKGIYWAFTATGYDLWQPMTWLSWMMDYEFYGLNGGGFHRTNLLLHIANSLLLFIILSVMTGAATRSGFVAALFALHPLHVESVAWIAERKDVLSTFFGMLTLLSYYYYVKHRSMPRYLLVLVMFILGLMSKPMLVTLPFILLLLDYWPLGRFAGESAPRPDQDTRWIWYEEEYRRVFSGLLLEKAPLLLFSAAVSAMAYFTQQHYGAVASAESFPLATRLANAVLGYVVYMEKAVWPWPMAVFYPHPGMQPVWVIVLCLLFLSITTWFVWRRRLSMPYFFTGWFWYLGAMVPVIGIIQVGEQAIADRYTYFPLIGLFIALTWGVAKVMRDLPWIKRAAFVVSCLMLVVFMVMARHQVRYWKNSTTMFTHALQVTSRNYLAHNNFGSILLERGLLEEALVHFRAASELKPEKERFHRNVGVVMYRQGKNEEAMNELKKAIQINPRYPDLADSGVRIVKKLLKSRWAFKKSSLHFIQCGPFVTMRGKD